MKIFHNLKYKTDLLNWVRTSKGAVRSRELSLPTREEMKTSLRKQEVTEYIRMIIRMGGLEIHTHTYTHTHTHTHTHFDI